MYSKSIDLKEFYDTLRGRVVQRIIRQKIQALWPDVKGQRIMGVGYALPYLRHFMGEAERVFAVMPHQQGAIYWPQEGKNLVSICDLAELPIESNSIDRLLVVHGLNSPESIEAILSEAWRVMTGQGRIILVIPNRSGIWARMDDSPFGQGTPYSLGQIKYFLKEYMFVLEKAERALFVPPSSSRLMLATAPLWENMGHRFFNAVGGVNIVEASKQIYAGTLVGVAAQRQHRVLTAPKTVSTLGSQNRS